jgi:hypothetical protein
MADQDDIRREVLPIPDGKPAGLTTYDAKDPDTKFPPIRQLRPPSGAPNVLIVRSDREVHREGVRWFGTNTTTKPHGTGMGFSICHSIVQAVLMGLAQCEQRQYAIRLAYVAVFVLVTIYAETPILPFLLATVRQ